MTNNAQEDVFEQVDEISHTILHHIQQGNDDIQKITDATTLPNHKTNYRFTKLEDLDLITVDKPDGMVERVISGQKRVIQAPKQAQLTEKGQAYLEQADTEASTEYKDMTREELIEKVHELDNRLATLENQLQIIKQQFQQKLR